MLSRRAARFGDRDAAVDWLEPCDQRPLDLTMDTAFRYATATLAAAAKKPDQVLALLGTRPGDVPLVPRDATGCSLLRIDSLAKTGEVDAATAQYDELHDQVGERLEDELERRRPLDLCRAPRMRLEARRPRIAIADEARTQATLHVGGLAIIKSVRVPAGHPG